MVFHVTLYWLVVRVWGGMELLNSTPSYEAIGRLVYDETVRC